ncbi:hypothetical protein J6S88_02460 [bacterium]|nr:hypothetical protein [bacterium]
MEIANFLYNRNNFSVSPNFTATARQHVRAVRYLKHVKLQAEQSVFDRHERLIKENKFPKSWIEKITHIDPNHSVFSHSSVASSLETDGILCLNIDKLEGIQYGIDVFKDLTMREIVFLAYRACDLAVRRGCANMCAHCFQKATPAAKTELSVMPFEDFKKIAKGFDQINKRINKILDNTNTNPPHFIGDYDNSRIVDNNAEELALFYDSDGINVIAKDINGKEYDYVDLAEMFYNATGKLMLFDTAGWNPENKILQQRAEKYAKYFSQPGIRGKLSYNLSVNTFNPLYLKSYKLGYRPGLENDLTNPEILRGKRLYDMYIERMANMISTLGATDNAYILATYATRYEKNMKGMYLSDLKQILKDVEKRCDEILKTKYSTEEYQQKQEIVSRLIRQTIYRIEDNNTYPRCTYAGRYQELFNSRNPEHPIKDNGRYTKKFPDINTLSYKEYQEFLRNYMAVIDTNGELYYQRYDTSVRPMGKELKLSTNGKKTPKINNLELRD